MPVPARAQVIPGTTIARPATDAACDKAIHAGAYAAAIAPCITSVRDYAVAVASLDGVSPTATVPDLSAQPVLLMDVRQELEYDEGYTDLEVALAYTRTATPDAGHPFAIEAERLYGVVFDENWAKINAVLGRDAHDHSKVDPRKYSGQLAQALDESLTPTERNTSAEFLQVMMRVNQLYPDVFAAGAAAAKQ